MLDRLKEDLIHATNIARQTLDITLTDPGPATERYRLILKKLEALQKIHALQQRSDQPLLRTASYSEGQVRAFLDRIAEEHQAIEVQLMSLLSIPWPRSPQAGLHSLQQQ